MTGMMLAALLVVAAITPLGVAAVVARRSWQLDLSAAVFLTLASLPWLRLSQPVEGRVLWTVTPSHGLCEADLIAAPVGLAAAVMGVRAVLILAARVRMPATARNALAQ